MSLADSVATIVRRKFPSLFYRGVFSYQVSSEADGTLNLKPETEKWLPVVPIADVWAGSGGYRVKPAPGSIVALAFLNADLRRPVVVNFCPPSIAIPIDMTIEASGDMTHTAGGTVAIDGAAVDLGNAEAPVIRDGDEVVIQDENNEPPTPMATGTIRLVGPNTIYPATGTATKVKA